MGINSYIYSGATIARNYCIDVKRNSMHTGAANKSETSDIFIKTSEALELRELERLFPQGEIYRIYDNIAKEYGICNVPKLKIISNSEANDKGLFDVVNNSITLNLLDLNPNTRKYRLEADGKYWYNLDETGLNLKTDSNPNTINENLNGIKNVGLKGSAVELTDDDKRKIIVFTLAHELEHCYQHQQMDKTDGISSFDAVKKRCEKQIAKWNLIEKYLFINQLEKTYYQNNSNIPVKVYKTDSPEGKQAIEWFNATVNYNLSEDEYNSYINNPLELDANTRAKQYLIKHYGDFKGTR